MRLVSVTLPAMVGSFVRRSVLEVPVSLDKEAAIAGGVVSLIVLV